jgi:hypothetical protein
MPTKRYIVNVSGRKVGAIGSHGTERRTYTIETDADHITHDLLVNMAINRAYDDKDIEHIRVHSINPVVANPVIENKDESADFPVYYACEICGHNHPWDWDGDCRDNANRFTDEQLDEKHGAFKYVLREMSERVAADNGE